MRKKRWVLVLLMLMFFAGSFFRDGARVAKANDETPVEDINPYKKPTGDVRKFLGIWMSSGYSLQPQDYNYTVVGNSVTLHTDQGRSMATAILSFGAPAHYQWYETTDGSKWSSVSKKNGGNKKNLTVTPSQVGTKYYQQETSWYWVIAPLSPTVYSKVASINTLDKDVDATDIEVTTDDDYIYNYVSQITTTTTYAHAHITPANFTGKLTWSIDNTDLATIDPDSGLITANNQNKSGKVTVTATATNADGSVIKGSETVTVGGGLEDQTVDAGDKATFTLLGNIGEFDDQEDLSYTIQWFKEDPITHAQEEIDTDQKSVSWTTPKTTLNDDGTLVFAYITVKVKNSSTGAITTYDYTTNEATLHVNPVGGVDIDVKDTLENKTYNGGSNSSTTLYDVNKGDNIIYHSAITNNSSGGQLKDGTYTLPLRKGSTVNDVLVDGESLSDDDYDASVDSDTGEVILNINNLNLDINQTKNLEVDTNVGAVDKRESYKSTAYLKGKDSSGSSVQKVGTTRYMNLTTGKLEYKVKDIDYGLIQAIGNDPVIKRQNTETSYPDNIMEVDDMRRNKTPVYLFVNQEGDFTNKDTNAVLQGHLEYIDEDDNAVDILSGPKLIAQSQDGQGMSSLSWQHDQGIVLAMDNNKMNSGGLYETTVVWNFSDSL